MIDEIKARVITADGFTEISTNEAHMIPAYV
jgi:hypothetical protein